MVEEHTELDIDMDKKLLEDVLDTPNLRYVALYMFSIRKRLFEDLLNDAIIEEFQIIMDLRVPTKSDLQRICSQLFIRRLIDFNIIKNVSDYEIYKIKPSDFKIRLEDGIKLAQEDISDEMVEVHIFCKERYLERLIRKDMPEITGTEIHKALERMRAMMCPVSSAVHELIHKYDEYYVLNDDFYYIIEDLGNPYQAIRIELMIRDMSDKYGEIERDLDKRLKQFHPDLTKAKILNKFRKIIELKKKEIALNGLSSKKGNTNVSPTNANKKKNKYSKNKHENIENSSSVSNSSSSVSSSDDEHNRSKVLSKSDILRKKKRKNKFESINVKLKHIDFTEKLKDRMKKGTLPPKFNLEFERDLDDGESQEVIPPIYQKWKKALNDLVRLKLEFDIIDKDMDNLRRYYSGKNQIMPYMTFIQKATFNEDNIADTVRDLLLEARNKLKKISDGCDLYDVKDLKLLNLDLERKIIEEGWYEEEEE